MLKHLMKDLRHGRDKKEREKNVIRNLNEDSRKDKQSKNYGTFVVETKK